MDFPPPIRLDGDVPAYAPPLPPSEVPAAPARRGAPFAIVGVLVVVALVAVAILALTGREERSAEDRLGAAQAFVAAATSVELDFDIEATISTGSPGSRASSVSTERMGGVVYWTPQAWRVHQESRYGEDETIFVDGTVYTRSSFAGSTLEDEPWYSLEWEDPTRQEVLDAIEAYADLVDEEDGYLSSYVDAEGLGVLLGGIVYVSGLDRMADLSGELVDDPVGFADSIRSLADPTIVAEHDDVTTLGATLHAPMDLVEAFGHPIPSGAVELDVDADDVPQAMRLEVAGGGSRYWIELRFAGWGDVVEIQAPPADEVESYDDWSDWSEFEEVTPEITPVEGLTPMRPNASLGTWTLESAYTWDEYFMEDPACTKAASLSWFLEGSDEEDDWGTYVGVDLMTVECAIATAEDEAGLIDVPAAGSVTKTQVDEWTWLFVTADSVAMVTVDAADDSLVAPIIDSLELVEWEALQQDVGGAGF